MEKTDCDGVMGSLFGHKYQPRYSVKKEPSEFTAGNMHGYSAEESVAIPEAYMHTESAYEGDVCVRCGSVVNRK